MESNGYTLKNEFICPPQRDVSLTLTVVDGYIRNIDESTHHIPDEITGLIKRFYPQLHSLYGIGWNHYGELALGHNKVTPIFQRLTNFEAICDDANDIHAGWKRFMVRNCFNNIFCVGRNVENDLGIIFSPKPKPKEINMFHEMNTLINTASIPIDYRIFSGNFAFHTFILSSNSELYVMGQNNCFQCGYINTILNEDLPFNGKPRAVPILLGHCKTIFDDQYIAKICCGDNFSVFLTSTGTLFSCGNNRYGSCGFPIIQDEKQQFIQQPTQIKLDFNARMIDINCGGRHAICICDDYDICCFGQNLFNQLGIAMDDTFNTGIPRINPYFNEKKISRIVCGFSHTIAIAENGNAYLFGRNHKGQCGKYYDGQYNVFETIQTPFLFQDIMSVSTDHVNKSNSKPLKPFENILIRDGSGGYEHTVLITNDNQLISFGGNASKQCCISSKDLIVSPVFMDKSEIGLTHIDFIERVICGIDTTLIVCAAL